MAAKSVPSPDARYGTVPQAAQRFGVSVRRLRKLVKDGTIPSYAAGTEKGARRRVAFAEVEAWLRSTRVEAPSDFARRRVAEILAREERRRGPRR